MINKFRISQALILAFIVILILPEVKESFKAWGITWTYIALLSSCITYTLIPAVAEIATRLGAVDQPGGRHAHTVTTPLMGGAAIFLGFALVMVFARDILFFSLELKAVAFAASLIFISEALDDIWGLSPA